MGNHGPEYSVSALPEDSVESLQVFCSLRTIFRRWIEESYQRQISLPLIGKHDELSFARPWIFHYLLTGEPDILDKVNEFFCKWKDWADKSFIHGYYPENAEEHHHTENFTRVAGRLWIFDSFRKDYAEALIDMAHHIGNWDKDAPQWYDWNEHRFVARWLGTEKVGAEERRMAGANGNPAFRYLILSEQAYLLTGEQKYLDLILDNMVPDFSEEPLSNVIPEELEVIPTSRYAADMNWIGEDDGGACYLSRRPAVLYALKYQISGEEKFLQTAFALARKRLELAVCLGDEGRFHGCGRGNIRTVIDEDVLPVMHATALGLHGIAFDGNAHLQPDVHIS